MIKSIIEWGWVRNKRQANALLLTFAVCCFIWSGYFFQKAFTSGPELAFNFSGLIK